MSKKAFTLIEMLVTITIISILAGFVVVKINDSNNLAKDTQRKADINLLANSVVSYSSDHYSGKPITDENGCTIGGGTDRCSTEIEDALKAYLPTLPSEPSSSAYYIYWSNGNDCTVTANLSSSNPDDAYVYSCTPDTASAGDAVNGACGSSANTSATGYASSVSDWPSSNFCNSGTLHTSPAWPVQGGSTTWTCVGEYLGNNVTCTAYRAQDAVCGTREKRYADAATSYGTDTICTIGTGSPASPAFPAKGASTTWTCAGVYTGTSTTCTAQHSLNGVCGTNAQAYASGVTAYSGTFCAAGTASPASPAFPASGASVSWTCLGALSGTNASCTASRAGAPVAGTCGTSAQTCDSIALASAPTANLCATGTASALSGTGPWTWTCAGLYGGATSGTCTAYKANLCNSQHASQQCTCKGGTVVSVGSCSVCKLGNACSYGYCCPSGWTRYGSWSEGQGACYSFTNEQGQTYNLGTSCGDIAAIPNPIVCGSSGIDSHGCTWRTCPNNGWAWGNSTPAFCEAGTQWPTSFWVSSLNKCNTYYCPCCPSARLGCY